MSHCFVELELFYQIGCVLHVFLNIILCYMHCTFNCTSLSLCLSIYSTQRGIVDLLNPDSENEEKKKREKREKEGSTKDKLKIPKRNERFMLIITSFVFSVQDETVQPKLSWYICFLLYRYIFSEKMLSACQTLEVHLNGSKVISNRELVSYRTITEICLLMSVLLPFPCIFLHSAFSRGFLRSVCNIYSILYECVFYVLYYQRWIPIL